MAREQARRLVTIERRTKQIRQRNPGHPAEVARQAAMDEELASLALCKADPAMVDAARRKLRAMQLRAANLDLDLAAAAELARIQLTGEPWHGSGDR